MKASIRCLSAAWEKPHEAQDTNCNFAITIVRKSLNIPWERRTLVASKAYNILETSDAEQIWSKLKTGVSYPLGCRRVLIMFVSRSTILIYLKQRVCQTDSKGHMRETMKLHILNGNNSNWISGYCIPGNVNVTCMIYLHMWSPHMIFKEGGYFLRLVKVNLVVNQGILACDWLIAWLTFWLTLTGPKSLWYGPVLPKGCHSKKNRCFSFICCMHKRSIWHMGWGYGLNLGCYAQP